MDIKAEAATPKRHYPWDAFGSFEHTVGVLWPCYGSGHVIYGLGSSRYNHRTLATVTLPWRDTTSTYHRQTPFVVDASVPLVHTFNALPVNKDFIVSFELELPRFLGQPSEAQVRRGIARLESSRCKAILALSDFAFGYASRRLIARGFAHVVDKMSVFRGGVADPLAGQAETSARTPRLSFAVRPLAAIVVGSQLFRKGGMQAIQAFEKLRAEGMNVSLTLVGNFEDECYAMRDSLPSADAWRARAESHDWIRFLGPLPHARVIAELQRHDICLYPSLDESLGWLTIEAGMLGVPVLGNRVCAFPELIQHRQSGWLVDLSVDADGRWQGIGLDGDAHRDAVASASEAIVHGIEECMRYAQAHPLSLHEWGTQARAAMRARYDMAKASAELERIYDQALKRS